MTAFTLLSLGPALLAVASPPNAAAEIDPQTIIGGAEVDPCAWPSAARASASSYSFAAVLIHPQVVALTEGLSSVAPTTESFVFSFGYASGGFPPNPGLYVSTPVTNCHYADSFGVCTLEEPVDLPYAPPLFGCEQGGLDAGTELIIVGFGDIGTESNRAKRAALVTVREVDEKIIIVEGEAGPCSGDLGSPAFSRMQDGSWRTVGIAAGQECGDTAMYMALHSRVPWIEEVTGIDVSPCHDAEGFPDPGPDCQGFFAGDGDDFGTWFGPLCSDGPLGGDGGVCSSDPTPPTVAIDAPSPDANVPDAPSVVVVEVSAEDADGLGVRDVRLSINGELLPNERNEPPYTFEVELPEGSWTLVGIARDWGGNEAESEAITVSVGDPPPPMPGTSTGADETSGDDAQSGETDPTADLETSGSGSGSGRAQDEGGGCRLGGSGEEPWLLGLLGLGFGVAVRRPRRRR